MNAQTRFQDASRYRDPTFDQSAVKVLPGGFAVGSQEEVFVTVLGSCVAACIRDPILSLGGMNHFLLPEGGEGTDGASARYGDFAMEMLLNELYKKGAQRGRLEAKVAGGGNVVRGITSMDVGARNARFVEEFLETEKIRVVGRDLCGQHARKVYYFPRTGRMAVKRIDSGALQALVRTELNYSRRLSHQPIGGDGELF